MTAPIAPPEGSVWTKYSPNHEFPVASATSLVLHALVFGVILIMGLALNAHWHDETSQPPPMNVAFIQAPAGDGLDPGGGSPTGPIGSKENVDTKQPPAKDPELLNTPTTPLDPITPKTPSVDLLPNIGEPLPVVPNDFNKLFPVLPNLPANKGNPTVGKGGNGSGTGQGSGVGPGIGKGGVPGGATEAEILATRWRFNPSGSPHEHLQKIIAAGVRLGFKDGNNYFWMITDLKKRPVNFQKEDFEKYKDTVKWYNQRPESVIGLHHEIGLPAPPAMFILLLPKDREQLMANAELQFTKNRNRDISKVQATWFDFRLRGGVFEPVVIGQEPFDPRPKW